MLKLIPTGLPLLLAALIASRRVQSLLPAPAAGRRIGAPGIIGCREVDRRTQMRATRAGNSKGKRSRAAGAPLVEGPVVDREGRGRVVIDNGQRGRIWRPQRGAYAYDI